MFRKIPIQYLGRNKSILTSYYTNEKIIIQKESIMIEKLPQSFQMKSELYLMYSRDKKKQEEEEDEYYSLFMIEHIPTIQTKK